MRRIIITLVVTSVYMIASGLDSESATIGAASCSRADVRAAIAVANDGDIVRVPSGVCTWGTPNPCTRGEDCSSVYIKKKSITLQGAGVDQTIIIDNSNTEFYSVALGVYPSNNSIRITGFTFRDTGTKDPKGVITFYGDYNIGAKNSIRIDHIKFDNITSRALWLSNEWGTVVVDHNIFRKSTEGSQQPILVSGNNDSSWAAPMSIGGSNAVFIEDNEFDYSYPNDGLDCQDGGRYVFRHNVVDGLSIGAHGFDSVTRGCMQMEIYENTFRNTRGREVWPGPVQFRGGTGVVFNNTVTGNYPMGIAVTNYRSCCYAGAACLALTCDGSSPLDGNTLPRATYKGWPCRDQIGRGTNQASAPLYQWNNIKDGAMVRTVVYNTWPGCTNPQPLDHVQANRDYYDGIVKPGYTPHTYPHPLTVGLDSPKNLRVVER